MKHRAHVLHKQLQGFVQRKTMSVLKDELPSKCVYVISVRLSPLQRALYLKFLETYGLQNGTLVKQSGKSFLFEAYHTLAKVRKSQLTYFGCISLKILAFVIHSKWAFCS